MTEPVEPRVARARPWALALLGVLIVCVAAVRWRLLDVPLERDEGEYAYAGSLLLEGIPPYAEAYNMKLPGIYAAYALVMGVFGESDRGIHLGLLVANVATLVLLFLLARRLAAGVGEPLASVVGLGAAACYAILSLSTAVQGLWANAEHFVLPCALLGTLLVVDAVERSSRVRLVLGALALGLGFVVKQHGAAFVAAAGLIVLSAGLRRRPRAPKRLATDAVAFAVAALVPYALTCGLLALAGVFDTFWFWTFEYAREYTGQVPRELIGQIFRTGFDPVFASGPLIWILGASLPLVLVFDRDLRRNGSAVVLFVVFGALAVLPGFFFRPHYFVFALPGLALAAALGAAFVARRLPGLASTRARAVAAAVVLTVCVGQAVWTQADVLFELTPFQVVRKTYGLNPFPESVEVGRLLDELARPDDRIAVIGSEPQIYLYSKRRAATGYMYTYALMEDHRFNVRMQQEFIAEVEASAPAFCVFANVSTSWLVKQQSPNLLFQWWERFVQGYELIALAEIRPGGTNFVQGPRLAGIGAPPQNSLAIYRRLP